MKGSLIQCNEGNFNLYFWLFRTIFTYQGARGACGEAPEHGGCGRSLWGEGQGRAPQPRWWHPRENVLKEGWNTTKIKKHKEKSERNGPASTQVRGGGAGITLQPPEMRPWCALSNIYKKTIWKLTKRAFPYRNVKHASITICKHYF